MHDVAAQMGSGFVVVLSLILAVVFPIMARRYVRRQDRLMDLWLTYRPGVLTALCLSAIALLIVSGAACTLGALMYPFLWATVALHVGVIAAVLVILRAHHGFKKRESRDWPRSPQRRSPGRP